MTVRLMAMSAVAVAALATAGGAAWVAGARAATGVSGPVALVVNHGSRSVTPVDLKTGMALPAIRVGRSPDAIAVAPGGRVVYVADSGSGTVTPITVATLRAGRPIPVGADPVALAMAPDGKTLYVACDQERRGTVVPVRLPAGRAGRPISVGEWPDAIAVTPDSREVLVADQGNPSPNSLRVISARSGKQVARTPLPGFPYAIAVAPGGRVAYVPGTGRARAFPKLKRTDWMGIVTPVRLDPVTAGRQIVLGHDPYMGNESPDAVAFSPDGSTAWISYPGVSKVLSVNTATGKVGRPVRTGYYPFALAVTPDGRQVYVAEGSDVAAIGTRTRKVTFIKAGPTANDPLYPGASVITAAPDGKTVYVLNYRGRQAGTLTPISVATNRPGRPIRVGVNPVSLVIVR